jgi:hypothetical protein
MSTERTGAEAFMAFMAFMAFIERLEERLGQPVTELRPGVR